MANTQEYRTYLEWRKIGRQVKKGEHGERNHIGETVFGFEQTSALNSEKRIELGLRSSYRKKRIITDWDDDGEDEAFRIAYDPNY